MSPWLVLIVLILWVFSIVAGYYLGKRKGRRAAGLWLTVLLGPIGLAILAFALRPVKAETPPEETLTAVGSIQPPWAGLSETDSWVWR
jgi:hypothetical protein